MANDECYTPLKWIEVVQYVFGGVIHFDPCSCEAAQKTVQAAQYFTKEDDALTKAWPIAFNVWMNPPYSRQLCDGFVYRMIDYYRKRFSFMSAIVLLNNGSASTRRGHAMLDACVASATPLGRINFDGQGDTNRYEQTFFLLTGQRSMYDKFLAGFRGAGCKIMVNMENYRRLE